MQRIRIDLQESSRAGSTDGLNLITELCNLSGGCNTPAAALYEALAGIAGLGMDSRLEELQAHLTAFCEVIGPILDDGCNRVPALEAKCILLSASLNQAEKEVDRLRHAVTDSEGGEL
jgi:hypothetical protein